MKEILKEINEYIIRFVLDSQYSSNSTDNINKYNFEYGKSNKDRSVTQIGIKIFKDDIEVTSAILLGYGGASGLHEKSFTIKDKKIIICIDNDVMCLNIPDLKIFWRKTVDDATCFEIYQFSDDFIIHGELSISRISSTGKTKWSFYGPDIFTEEFRISGNKVYATDFNHDVFIIDVESGKEI